MKQTKTEAFDLLAEMMFWGGMVAILVLILLESFYTYPNLDLSGILWPVLGVGCAMGAALTVLMVRPLPKAAKSVRAPIGHKHVDVDLKVLRASLRQTQAVDAALQEHHGPRSTDIPLRRSDVSDQPWIDGRRPSTRTPDQYSRSTDKRPVAPDPATVYDMNECREAYASIEKTPCASIDVTTGDQS